MTTPSSAFDVGTVIHKLKHYLPSQAPLKDFIHHNTLHAFQDKRFHQALYSASKLFGYKTYLHVHEYRERYNNGTIREEILDKVIVSKFGKQNLNFWKKKVIQDEIDESLDSNIGFFNHIWIDEYHLNLNKLIHPPLFRIIATYLDQGISQWKLPPEITSQGLIATVRWLETDNAFGLFRTKRPKQLLLKGDCSLMSLLELIIGVESLYEHFLFDQQFAHPGWSGMVSVLESHPEHLLSKRKISLEDFIVLELLLTIDQLQHRFGDNWKKIGIKTMERPPSLFSIDVKPDSYEVLALWHEALEWSYYHDVMAVIGKNNVPTEQQDPSYQAVFCIDDRSCSLRRHLEETAKTCETFGTPGFFNVEFYYQPVNGNHYTKACPAPVQPKFLIKEKSSVFINSKEEHLSPESNSFFSGLVYSPTIGFWSAIKLALGIFKPQEGPTCVTASSHVQFDSELHIVNRNPNEIENGLQLGFTIDQMTDRIEGLLKSIGLTKNFSPLVYLIGHGASSLNNTHYAGYDCGACSGRPGSVNARVASFMANHNEVRAKLMDRGITIPETTKFVGGLHDTTRDEIHFYLPDGLSDALKREHLENKIEFQTALEQNAVERSRRFALLNKNRSSEKIHQKIKLRSVSLFEPRPEYNHATNALCIIGNRKLTRNAFLDRRAFLNSYDPKNDPEGDILLTILRAAAPVCGGINLEYFFSRVDNQRLGAGTKLPHNVIGLIGVANGIDGDLRTGLPWQMVEIHEPIRLLMVIEQKPEIILKALDKSEATKEWFLNNWIHLISVHPETGALNRYVNHVFNPFTPLSSAVSKLADCDELKNMAQDIHPFNLIHHV